MKRKYRYKPIEVELLKWDGKNSQEVIDLCGWRAMITGTLGERFLYLDTLKGRLFVEVGSYIVKRSERDYDVIKEYMIRDIFEDIESEGEQ